MQMKSHQSAEPGPGTLPGSTRRHVNSRLRRASFYAGHLVKILEERTTSGSTSRGIIEARAYYVAMTGDADFQNRRWEKCLQHYSEAYFIYSTLSKSSSFKDEELFRDLITTLIEPSIRYAAYQLKLARTTSIDKIVARYLPDNKYVEETRQAYPDAVDEVNRNEKSHNVTVQESIQTITWRSRTVTLEDAATAQALAAVSAAEEKLSSFLSSHPELDLSAKASAYDEVLIRSQDAVDAIKTAIDELRSGGIPQGDRRMQTLQITKTAINFALVEWRVGRNRILCGSQDGAIFQDLTAKKPPKTKKKGNHRSNKESTPHKLTRLQERIVLFDSTLQSLDSLKELPGVAADQDFVRELQSKRAYFAALRSALNDFLGTYNKVTNHSRCFNIARSHALLSSTKPALALFSRAFELASTVKPSEGPADSPILKLDISAQQVTFLSSLLRNHVSHHRALAELESLQSSSAAPREQHAGSSTTPLIEKLNEWPSIPVNFENLVTYPPKVRPVPVKPVFLDVAWNHIEYPGREPEAKEETRVVNGLAGWFGFRR